MSETNLQLELRGKTALVVGGGLGIGLAAARELHAQGVRLAIADLDANRVQAASDELSAHGVCLDVRDPGAARSAVRDVERELGGLDILVNIVGKGMLMPAVEVSADVQRDVFETNYLHHVEFCSAFASLAIAAGRPGAITMVSSLAGIVPFPNQIAYGAAKAALNSYTSGLAVELGPHGIRVNCVAPGVVRTDRNTRSTPADAKLLRAIPLGRVADQSEVAAMIVFISSNGSSYLTGQTIVLDGGASQYTRFWA